MSRAPGRVARSATSRSVTAAESNAKRQHRRAGHRSSTRKPRGEADEGGEIRAPDDHARKRGSLGRSCGLRRRRVGVRHRRRRGDLSADQTGTCLSRQAGIVAGRSFGMALLLSVVGRLWRGLPGTADGAPSAPRGFVGSVLRVLAPEEAGAVTRGPATGYGTGRA